MDSGKKNHTLSFFFLFSFAFLFFLPFSLALSDGDSVCYPINNYIPDGYDSVVDSENILCSSVVVVGDNYYCDIDNTIICSNGCAEGGCVGIQDPECSEGYETCVEGAVYQCLSNEWELSEVCSSTCTVEDVTNAYCDFVSEGTSTSLIASLIAYWDFNEGLGTQFTDLVFSRNATFNNFTLNELGISSYSVTPNEWTSRLFFANSTDFHFLYLDSFSFSMWFNVSNTTAFMSDTFQYFNTDDLTDGYVLEYEDSTNDFIFNIYDGSDSDVYQANFNMTGLVQGWNHIVFTFDGNQSSYVYLNNVTLNQWYESGFVDAGYTAGYNNLSVWFASYNSHASSLDEYAVFNKSLSSFEVSVLYNDGVGTFFNGTGFSFVTSPQVLMGEGDSCGFLPDGGPFCGNNLSCDFFQCVPSTDPTCSTLGGNVCVSSECSTGVYFDNTVDPWCCNGACEVAEDSPEGGWCADSSDCSAGLSCVLFQCESNASSPTLREYSDFCNSTIQCNTGLLCKVGPYAGRCDYNVTSWVSSPTECQSPNSVACNNHDCVVSPTQCGLSGVVGVDCTINGTMINQNTGKEEACNRFNRFADGLSPAFEQGSSRTFRLTVISSTLISFAILSFIMFGAISFSLVLIFAVVGFGLILFFFARVEYITYTVPVIFLFVVGGWALLKGVRG